MATISRTGISDGSTARAEHITRIIDALDGTASTEVIATGSFTGSFTGDGSGLTGVGSTSNFANTDLTFTGFRTHDTDGNGFIIAADGTGVSGPYIGMTLQDLGMGASISSSYIGVESSNVTTSPATVVIQAAGTSSITISGTQLNINSSNKDHDVVIEGVTDTTLFVTNAATDRIGIGKNTPNAKLDVNGNTIITGSLTVTSRIGGTTRTTQDSIVVTNSSTVTGHPSGSGIYPGMIGNIDLNPSTTNAIRYVLGPLAEYTLGDRYEFQIVNFNGTSEEFRIEVNGADTNKMNAQVFGADGTNVIQRNINTVRFGTGNSYTADRIIVTACKSGASTLWNVQAHVSGGAGIVTA